MDERRAQQAAALRLTRLGVRLDRSPLWDSGVKNKQTDNNKHHHEAVFASPGDIARKKIEIASAGSARN